MGKRVVALDKRRRPRAGVDSGAVLNALASAVVVVDGADAIVHVNHSGEQLFQGSSQHLRGQRLADMLPTDNPVFALLAQVRADRATVSEYGVNLDSPRLGRHFVNIQASPVAERPNMVAMSIQERSIADRINHQLSRRGAARSVTAMARMLAHEVKNPLSGIRGAAQLLEETAAAGDRSLTQLIRGEVDRICALLDRMEVFSDSGPLRREPVNIHEVLTRVRQIAENGFARHVRIVESYDPSLPHVLGSRDQLIQVFLNLVKNAAEAVPAKEGEIVLTTAYRPGVRFALPGRESREHLPLMISVEDNGEGIPEDIKAHIFDPFVSAKPTGSGLGLALVAKVVDDHGGAIEVDSKARHTIIRVLMPMYRSDAESDGGDD